MSQLYRQSSTLMRHTVRLVYLRSSLCPFFRIKKAVPRRRGDISAKKENDPRGLLSYE